MVLTIKTKCKEYMYMWQNESLSIVIAHFPGPPPAFSPLLIRFFSQIQRRLPGVQSSTCLFFGFIVWETPAMSSFLPAIKSCTIHNYALCRTHCRLENWPGRDLSFHHSANYAPPCPSPLAKHGKTPFSDNPPANGHCGVNLTIRNGLFPG